MIYLDYAATTPMSKVALETYNMTAERFYGNPSSLHDVGSEATNLLEMCRKQCAEFINGNEAGIYFTSGGTEANERAILSLVEGNRGKGNHLITTAVEHSSVYNVFRYLETVGFLVTYLQVDERGKVCLDTLKQSIREETMLASIHHGNAEIGAVQDIAAIGTILEQADVIFHADCVQTFGKISVDVLAMKIDSLSVSSHKIYGPKGTGFCYINPHVYWENNIKGSTHESGFRAGTVDVPSIVAFTQAANEMIEKMAEQGEQDALLRAYFLEKLAKEKLPVSLIGGIENGLKHIVALSFANTQGQYVMLEYNRHSIAVSTGSACQVGQHNPSRTLLSMGMSVDEAKQLIRISFGRMTTKTELEKTVEVTKRIVEGL